MSSFRNSVFTPRPLSSPAQVNDALNNLLIEEEDFDALKHSIQSYDNFDQVRIGTLEGGRGLFPCMP